MTVRDDLQPPGGWPDVHLTRSEIQTQALGHIDNTTERYIPISQVRERLLSDEAVEAMARSTWNVNGRVKGMRDWGPDFPRDRDVWMEEARRDLEAALAAAAFPDKEGE
jgi:hypothetical protein